MSHSESTHLSNTKVSLCMPIIPGITSILHSLDSTDLIVDLMTAWSNLSWLLCDITTKTELNIHKILSTKQCKNALESKMTTTDNCVYQDFFGNWKKTLEKVIFKTTNRKEVN